ncbi:hypothetical protein EUX98_g816 [Antrodiella citrinella]|uniref:Glycoside hydrolase family 2 catalytic domain-containing protein n=1 Tax=Antrodiella citrinella TaxID=2447956 RepID=A0A4S4N5D9_9APHY|nr:hypothetical protein EUX98_g816 [Antrodiella citrinella]
MSRVLRIVGVAATCLVVGTSAQQWCGKNYMASEPIVAPGGDFPIPSTSSSPLLAFRCAPAIKPYLPEDASSPASFIVDATITNSQVAGAAAIDLGSYGVPESVDVTISIDGRPVAAGSVPLNSTKFEIPFALGGLRPQATPFNVSCSATHYGQGKTQTFSAQTQLSFLPSPPEGRSVTKMDLRTGALLAKPATGAVGPYETVFPIGFYTNFGGYLASNLSLLDEIKADGFTIVHPIPTFDNLTALDLVIDRMQELGLYLMYDMRWTYLNTSAVTEEVNRIKNRPNLLLWYTADEPDGNVDPRNGTSLAYETIYALDGYHPVSLVLNCENYYFGDYTHGTDIVLQDTYMIGNNVTFSSQWGTPCTLDYGDCGCDNCKGEFEDISTRMDEFAQRLFDLGWDRTKAVWGVPQAFGFDTYWKREPTGPEFVVQSALAINHGGLGIIPWNDPTTDDIKASATALAKAIPAMKAFILNPAATFQRVISGRVDVGVWVVGRQTLVLATNLNYFATSFALASVQGLWVGESVSQVFDGGAQVAGKEIQLQSVGTGAFIFE